MMQTDFKFLNEQTDFGDSNTIEIEIAYQLKRIADALNYKLKGGSQ